MAARGAHAAAGIGVPSSLAADDPESQARNAAFLRALRQLGWTDGYNLRIDFRWGAADAAAIVASRANWSRSRLM